MKPVLDREAGDLIRKGYTVYRDASLLDETLRELFEVRRGTDPVPGR